MTNPTEQTPPAAPPAAPPVPAPPVTPPAPPAAPPTPVHSGQSTPDVNNLVTEIQALPERLTNSIREALMPAKPAAPAAPAEPAKTAEPAATPPGETPPKSDPVSSFQSWWWGKK